MNVTARTLCMKRVVSIPPISAIMVCAQSAPKNFCGSPVITSPEKEIIISRCSIRWLTLKRTNSPGPLTGKWTSAFIENHLLLPVPADTPQVDGDVQHQTANHERYQQSVE